MSRIEELHQKILNILEADYAFEPSSKRFVLFSNKEKEIEACATTSTHGVFQNILTIDIHCILKGRRMNIHTTKYNEKMLQDYRTSLKKPIAILKNIKTICEAIVVSSIVFRDILFTFHGRESFCKILRTSGSLNKSNVIGISFDININIAYVHFQNKTSSLVDIHQMNLDDFLSIMNRGNYSFLNEDENYKYLIEFIKKNSVINNKRNLAI